MDKTAERLVNFANDLTYSDLTPATIEAAKIRLIDSMGCAMAAFLAPTARATRRLAAPVSDGPRARIFGTLTRTTPDLAALVNGAMVRYFDMSDAYLLTSTAHPSDNIPALLALAEATGASGKDLLLAIVISYEIQCRFCDTVPFQAKGWDQPAAGAPAAALAAARILGLSKAEMLHALALAIVPHIALNQTRAGELSMWKGMAGPYAAKQGLFAAMMAQAGMTGPEDPYEGDFGLWTQTMGESYPVKIPQRFKTHRFAVGQTNIKRFPVRDAIQIPIVAALELRSKIDIDSIETVRIDTYAKHFGAQREDKALWSPQTRETADHSLPFAVAAALIDGNVTPETFERERFLDKDIAAMMKRLRIELVDDFDKAAPATRSCRLVATMTDGKTVTTQHRQTPADIERGPSRKELEDKFHILAGRALDFAQRTEMLRCIDGLDKLKTVDLLVDLTAV